MLTFEKDVNIDAVMLGNCSSVTNSWTKQKAYRFIALYRSQVFSDKRLNLLNGLTVKGNVMSMPALSLNASMAAAFIHCTDIEAGIDDKDKQKLQKDPSLLQEKTALLRAASLDSEFKGFLQGIGWKI
jgi:hypothetical protein